MGMSSSTSSAIFLTLALSCALINRNVVRAAAVSVTGSVSVDVPTYGQVNGLQYTIDDGSQVDAFLGLPYAKPPVGSLRFSPPVSLDPIPAESAKIIRATTLPAACYQINSSNPYLALKTPKSEDCLYLNIWRPTNRPSNQLLAVMVWIYGGSFISGSSTLEIYDGKVLSSRNGVIVVSMQYRVGPTGFLTLGGSQYGAPGNAGLLDQQLAIKWVHDNIQRFGGDPNRVTLFGESAGSASVGYHLLSPGSAGLFQSAILESGTPIAPWAYVDPSQAEVRARTFAAQVGCYNTSIGRPSTGIMDCLRSLSIDQLWTKSYLYDSLGQPLFIPTVDGEFINQPPNQILRAGNFQLQVQKKNILIGVNKDEGSYFLFGYPPVFDPRKQTINVSNADYASVVKVAVASLALQGTTANLLATSLSYQYAGGQSGSEWSPDYLASSVNIFGDGLIVCPVVGFTRTFAKENNVYAYSYNHRPSRGIWPLWSGVIHGDEMQYVFGLPFQTKQQSWFQYTDDERILSDLMMYYWTNFAKFGDPNQGNRNPSAPVWPSYNLNSRTVLVLDTGSQLNTQSGLRERMCDYWLTVIPQFQAFGSIPPTTAPTVAVPTVAPPTVAPPTAAPPAVAPPAVITDVIQLPSEYNYITVTGVNLSDKSAILVYGQMANDFHIGLLRAEGDFTANSMYEIVVGGWGNTQSVIRKAKQGQNLARVPTVNFLSSTSFRTFWLTWANGLIQVGKGTIVGVSPFMAYSDPNPSAVKALALSGWNTAAGFAYAKVLP